MSRPTLEQLREQVRGEIIAPGDPTYDEARAVRNGMIDRRPSAVIRCAKAGDVMSAVNYTRENGLDVAIRGGAHSVPGFGTVDDGIVIDLSGMRGVRVEPVARTARPRAGPRGGTSMRRRTPSDSRRPAGSSPRPASQG